MQIKKLSSDTDIQRYIKHLGVDSGGISILHSKSEIHFFYIRELHVGGANILKQDALSIGADLAVPRGTVVARESHVDAILIATTKHLKILSKKELAQPFGLKKLAMKLQDFLQGLQLKQKKVQIMGVINANDDSFYEASRYTQKKALDAIYAMVEEGADIIDIGAVSSRPNAPLVTQEEEFDRLKELLKSIQEHKVEEDVTLSIDSYSPVVVEAAMDAGFSIINDITGFRDERMCELAARYKAKVVVMHMQGTPQTMQKNPNYEDVIIEIEEFFQNAIKRLECFGVEDIVLDVGIGFGKTLEHNLALIRHLQHFSLFQKELLVGASRKSMIDALSPSMAHERLAGTLTLHLEALRGGANILRVHDVFEHKQALRVQEALWNV